jgi:hypothetical protein
MGFLKIRKFRLHEYQIYYLYFDKQAWLGTCKLRAKEDIREILVKLQEQRRYLKITNQN